MSKAKIATRAWDEAGKVFMLTFTNGHQLRFDIQDCTPAIRERAERHGFEQKICDTYSGVKGDVMAAIAAAESTAEALLDGDWNRRGDGGLGNTDLAQAVSNVTGRDFTETVALIAKLRGEGEEGKKKLAAMRKHPQIQAELTRIIAERAKAAAESVDDTDFDLESFM